MQSVGEDAVHFIHVCSMDLVSGFLHVIACERRGMRESRSDLCNVRKAPIAADANRLLPADIDIS